MLGTSIDKFQALVSNQNWDQLIPVLLRLDSAVAADIFMDIPAGQQDELFRRLPIEFAAKLAEILPCYDVYALLRARSSEDQTAIVDHIKPADRLRLSEELPEDSWQNLLNGQTVGALSDGIPAKPAGPTPLKPLIEGSRIEKSFRTPEGGRVQVIAPTDLSIEPGMIVALLGPSGSGKSTLLRMLSGLVPPTSGQVFWHGQPIAESFPNVAMVFQSFALFPWLTVAENVQVPLQARGIAREQRNGRALDILSLVGLKGFENAYPKELSGGMKQRVGFARALAVEPEVLFMDEPFSALDVLTAENLRGELLDLWLSGKISTRSIFIVTHNIEEAVMLADRIIVLGKNPAKIRADFRVPIPHPRPRTSAEFVLYVDYIYKLMMRPGLKAEPLSQYQPESINYQMLPHARQGGIAGLLEMLNGRGGKDDLHRLAADLRMAVDGLLPIVEAAALLGFARSNRGEIESTPQGNAFVAADRLARKQLFRDAILAHIHLLRQIHGALAAPSGQSLTLEFFRDLLREHFPENEVSRQIETALNWGRYGDLFAYDADSDRLLSYKSTTQKEAAVGALSY
jgi:NitT/TauT family transport system ATP-binding protein